MIEHLRPQELLVARPRRRSRSAGCSTCWGATARGCRSSTKRWSRTATATSRTSTSIAFLVQNGETDAAISIYHRAIARPNRAVSEYVKVYTSLWVLDLSRRSNKVADGTAEAYLRTLDQRHPELRPHRGASWYRQLARYAVGKIDYARSWRRPTPPPSAPRSTSTRRCAAWPTASPTTRISCGRRSSTRKMFSFFEFDMASRYLRVGAPSSPPAERSTAATETI